MGSDNSFVYLIQLLLSYKEMMLLAWDFNVTVW